MQQNMNNLVVLFNTKFDRNSFMDSGDDPTARIENRPLIYQLRQSAK
jgi:hypothetical protein